MAPLIRVALYMGKWTDPQALPLMLFERDSHVHAEVWPLDFKSFYLHAMHDSPVVGVDITVDGLQALTWSVAVCA